MPDHKTLMTALDRAKKEVLANCKTCGGSGATYTPEDCHECYKCPDYRPVADYGTVCRYLHEIEREGSQCQLPHQCPDCAPVRALDLCWHEQPHHIFDADSPPVDTWITEDAIECDNCHAKHKARMVACIVCDKPIAMGIDWKLNPDLTTHMHGSKLWLVHVLQVLGEWGQVVKYIRESCMIDEADLIEEEQKFADTIADGKKLVPEVEAYMTEREG